MQNTKINFKWIEDLNVKNKTLKMHGMEENIQKLDFHDHCKPLN